jgi:hypothetical protein
LGDIGDLTSDCGWFRVSVEQLEYHEVAARNMLGSMIFPSTFTEYALYGFRHRLPQSPANYDYFYGRPS